MTSVLELQEAWQNHPRSRQRAFGGRRALDGFRYQLAVSLERFFDAVLTGNLDATEVAFEGLSDLAEMRDRACHLTQIKTTLTREALRSALQEALAIDEFLEECFPHLRDHFNFKIVARRVHPAVPLIPALLSAADLRFDGEAALRWHTVRARCLPVTIDSTPEIRLAVALWRDVTRPIHMIDTCTGVLLDLLSTGATPSAITTALLRVWEAARNNHRSPLHLLGAADIAASDASSGKRIIHGVRPTFDDLRDGCFMERSPRIEAALSTVREWWASKAQSQQSTVPVFWIAGPSGAGKSVLLLQLAARLLEENLVEAVNFIESYVQALPRALESAADSPLPIVVVGDDLYSPDNRDPGVWQAVGEIVATRRFPSRFGIFTCGPAEQLRAFKRQCSQHRALRIVEIAIEPLDAAECVAYHAWYQQRTHANVPASREVIFIGAAWMYELHRQEKLTPDEFAQRFYDRLKALEIERAARAALVLNIYGLKAPESLFADHRPQIAQLVSERIWRLTDPLKGTLTGRFFHPQISRLIYESLVPRAEIVRRAEDFAYAFDSMLGEGEPADTFLAWLGAIKSGSNQTRGALLLDVEMRGEILRALWHCFRRHGPDADSALRLLRWHQIAASAGVDVRTPAMKSCVEKWWREADQDSRLWALLFQVVWDTADAAARPSMLEEGRIWLETNPQAGAWSWIYNRLIAFAPMDKRLRAQGIRWLATHPSHAAWPGVWGNLFTTRGDDVSERITLLTVAIAAIAVQPESDADIAIWKRAEQLEPPRDEFLRAILRKLASARNPYKVEMGARFLLERIPRGGVVATLSPTIVRTVNERAWPHIWYQLVSERSDEFTLLSLGRDWLQGRDDRPEWNYVWQALIDNGFEHASLLPRGRDWLKERDDRPDWKHVWQALIDNGFEHATLLPRGRDWLHGREERAEWAHIWRALIDNGFERASLLPRGYAWLQGRDERPEWAHIWQALIDNGFEHATLLPRGRDWLQGRDDRPEWPYVWRKLIDHDFERATLLPRGRDWLQSHRRSAGSSAVAARISA